MENNTLFLEGIFCSIGKTSKLGIRYEKLKINSYFWQTQPQDKKAMAKEFDAQLFLDIQDEAGNYARTARTTRE